METQKGRTIAAIGTFMQNVTMIDGDAHEWIDAKEFSLATLAKQIGLTPDTPVRLKVTLQLIDEHCEFCGELTTSDHLCDQCFTTVCDKCAKKDAAGSRFCPNCAKLQGLT